MAPAPAPASTRTSSPAAVSLPSASGTRATRRSPCAVSLATPTFMGITIRGHVSWTRGIVPEEGGTARIRHVARGIVMSMTTFRLPHAAAATLLGVGAAQASDAITFIRLLIEHGTAAEANPIVAALAGSGMLGLLLVAKGVVVAMVVGVVLLGWRRYPVAAGLVATLGVFAGLLGATSNVLVRLHPSVG